MSISFANPNVGMIALVVGTFLLGNQLGGEWARRREVREDIRDIQRQHKETLARMDSIYKAALQQDAEALAQVQAIYNLLGELQIKEVQVRGNIQQTKKKIEEGQQKTQALQNQVKEAAKNSAFSFYEDN
jgi:peptidoglycan hydrolase CwlO-like protein